MHAFVASYDMVVVVLCARMSCQLGDMGGYVLCDVKITHAACDGPLSFCFLLLFFSWFLIGCVSCEEQSSTLLPLYMSVVGSELTFICAKNKACARRLYLLGVLEHGAVASR
jgi:hypothetical protein